MAYDNQNIFAKILRGELPCIKVYEDEHTIAILDVAPLFEGHVLLMPKRHIELIMDVPKDLGARLFENTQLIARGIQTAFGCQGIFIGNNNVVSQSVPHTHIHIVPRNKKDGLYGFFYPRHPYRDAEHMEEVRVKLEEAIGGL